MIGTQIGSYQILSLLGTGGMGEVYRARDLKLGRDVAIKVLPASVAQDPDRVARFAREARFLAALNHPRIATIHGFEDADGICALVMELVEGPTLAERLRQESRRNASAGLPLAEVLKIGGEIAEALEAAHDKGVIHRDLKPANIKLTWRGAPPPRREDGRLEPTFSAADVADMTVKVLDFGLATAFMSPGSGDDAAGLPTVTATGMDAGRIVGTPAYMSPEQARGQAVDKRTDIWAFGCVLYEMLTGKAVFAGATVQDTLAAVLERDPDWTALPPTTPVAIQLLVRRCLEKNPKRRLRDIGDAGMEIQSTRDAPPEDARAAHVPVASRSGIVWASALAIVALAAAAGVWALRPTPATRTVWSDINTPPTRNGSVALSPDGLKVVFVATSQLWIRSLDSPSAQPLAGTAGALTPFWSPDSRSIGFVSDGKLKRMDVDSASVQTLAYPSLAFGGTWSHNGTIVYAGSPGEPLRRISETGGEPVAVTEIKAPQHRSHTSPWFLPDGQHFLFFVDGSPEARGVYLGQLAGGAATRLFDADTPAVYIAMGYLLFVRGETLVAQRFDPDRLELSGSPVRVADQVSALTTVTASAAGPIAYRTRSPETGQRRFVWIDRSGAETAEVTYTDGASQGPALSRDGRHVAVFRYLDGNMDVWTYDIERRQWDRVTFDSHDEIFPLWSPDGTRLVFGSSRTGRIDMFLKSIGTAPGSEEILIKTAQSRFPMDWSRDGRFLLYDSFTSGPQPNWDMWACPVDGDRTPFEIVRTDYNERLGQFSPDGKWIAYESDKTGRFEIYLRPFQGPGADLPVSTGGGTQPRWSPDGKELFYVAADDKLMTVPIRPASTAAALEVGTPAALFATTVGSMAANQNRQQYAVSPDGRSFVMNSMLASGGATPVTVILNWQPPSSK